MNETQKGVITLIKSAITGEKYPLPEGFNIGEAYDFIMKHKIIMLAYEGAVRCGISKNEPAMQKLFKHYVQGMFHSEEQMKAVNKIYSAFDENGIDYLPLKGCNMKFLYPKPELRAMGDADILIKEEQYKTIKKVLEKRGFAEEQEISHHYVWDSEKLHFELHTMLIPASYPKFKNYYGTGWNKSIKTETNRFVYSVEDEFVFIFTHFAKHYLEGGIGLRHITDIFVYLEKFREMDFDYIEAEFEKLGILKFYKNVVKTVDFYFNNGTADEAVNVVSEYILASGNWGSYKSHVFANGARNSASKKETKGSKIKFFLNAAFPPAEYIQSRYKILKKAPFLLVIIWPIRWADALLFKRKSIQKKFKKIDIINDKESEIYRDQFRKSGFDF